MFNTTGELIYASRIKQGLSQKGFGSKYDVTRLAVYKFEKGHMRPSLERWLRMSRDMNIPEMTAVLIWLKTRLPERFRNLIPIKSLLSEPEVPSVDGPTPSGVDYTKFSDRKAMRKVAMTDRGLPEQLREFLKNDEIWVIYKPEGEEINFFRDTFGRLGRGSVEAYREALRAVRAFKLGGPSA